MRTRVSVLLPVRDGEATIEKAIESIRSQSERDWELIVVDDGSVDSTAEIVRAIKDDRLRYLRVERVGLPAALNAGLLAAVGTYVARQDADDQSMRDRLAVQADFLDKNPGTVLVGCGFCTRTPEGTSIASYRGGLNHDAITQRLHDLDNPFAHTGVMFRRSPVLALGAYRVRFGKAQDYDLYLRLAERHRVASVPELLCSVTVSMDSATSAAAGGEQLRFGALALASGLLRRRGYSDPLDGPDAEAFIEAFNRWYQASRYPGVFLSRQQRRAARIAIADGDIIGGLTQLSRSLVSDPVWLARRVLVGTAKADLDRWAASWAQSRQSR